MAAGQIIGWVTGLVVALVVVTAVVWWARRRRTERRRRQDEQLRRRTQDAGQVLVRTDERARLAEDELSFAVAEVGDGVGDEFGPTLQRARAHLGEAFHLNQLLHDEIPDTDAERHTWSGRIVAACAEAETLLDDVERALAERRSAVRATPDLLEQTATRADSLADAVSAAREDVERLRGQYTEQALRPVADNPEQAERLLDFARRGVTAARKRLAAGRKDEAATTARAAEESVRRAEGLLAAVDDFEHEVLRAEAALGAVVAECREELAQARALPQRTGAVDEAVRALEAALAAVPAAGQPSDPVGALTRLRGAAQGLDDAVREHEERAAQARRAEAARGPAIQDAERQIAAARGVVDDYRAPVGPDARTRLAEAERELAAARDAADAEQAVTRARRAASLGAEAATLAQRDLRAHHGHGGYGQGGYGQGMGLPRGRSGSDVFGAVLGGMVLGGILDDIGDLGDFFD
ncbi:hypothetical protein [Isoptericola sediminis]|uniref:TPM domain-containing protein n=1 Tax=Isoptericola sediminis TaxID=2733572 RepID=A0A849JZK2_9MICO|nr:hypothetical protein [Isoptericola sediminis]NNU28712.1 hypothetical protein [Isoptericola sediminis]